MNDLSRESLRQSHPDLADLADEINPFKSEDFIDLVTIIDDDDLKKFGQFDEKTLLEKYYENIDVIKSAQPELPLDTPSVVLRKDAGFKSKRRTTQAETQVKENGIKE